MAALILKTAHSQANTMARYRTIESIDQIEIDPRWALLSSICLPAIYASTEPPATTLFLD